MAERCVKSPMNGTEQNKKKATTSHTYKLDFFLRLKVQHTHVCVSFLLFFLVNSPISLHHSRQLHFQSFPILHALPFPFILDIIGSDVFLQFFMDIFRIGKPPLRLCRLHPNANISTIKNCYCQLHIFHIYNFYLLLSLSFHITDNDRSGKKLHIGLKMSLRSPVSSLSAISCTARVKCFRFVSCSFYFLFFP